MDKLQHTRAQLLLRTLLRDVRTERNIRQQQLADAIDEPQSFVSKVESGERRLDVLELREVCRALGIPFMEFLARLEVLLNGDAAK